MKRDLEVMVHHGFFSNPVQGRHSAYGSKRSARAAMCV
jgi:hypothetical protein